MEQAALNRQPKLGEDGDLPSSHSSTPPNPRLARSLPPASSRGFTRAKSFAPSHLTPPLLRRPLQRSSSLRLSSSPIAERSDTPKEGQGVGCTDAAFERAIRLAGLDGLAYQPGLPKRFEFSILSYNLNTLPLGAGLLGGPGHSGQDVRLAEFVDRPELKQCQVLLLQEVFATQTLGISPLKAYLCRQVNLSPPHPPSYFTHILTSSYPLLLIETSPCSHFSVASLFHTPRSHLSCTPLCNSPHAYSTLPISFISLLHTPHSHPSLTPVLLTFCSHLAQTWLRKELWKRGFVHQVVSPFSVGLRTWTDSGLLIASRVGILQSGALRFARGRSLDAGASKGVIYAKLQVSTC